jgi:alkylated DNA nucleotide flippase Atl1
MPRSDEAEAFFHAVYSAVQEIPHGKVTTYGHIAMLVGTRKQTLTHPKSQITNTLQLKDLVKSASV